MQQQEQKDQQQHQVGLLLPLLLAATDDPSPSVQRYGHAGLGWLGLTGAPSWDRNLSLCCVMQLEGLGVSGALGWTATQWLPTGKHAVEGLFVSLWVMPRPEECGGLR